MRCTSTSTVLGLFAVATSLFGSLAAAAASDYDEAYCSTQNVASDTDKFYWQWQSESKCTEHCQGYAYSIIKYTDCWCSNYAPNTQTDITDCAVDCPGYPSEHCGDRSKNLFIYLANGPIPSGTQGASQPSSTVVSIAPPVPSSTEDPPSTEAPPPSSTTQAQTSAVDSPTHNDPFPTPTLVTESGQVVTRTVMFTPTSAPSQTGKDDDGSNTGAIIGGAIGGVLGILAIVGGILYFLWRRRKEQKKDQEAGANNSPTGISRNVSTMSKAGLLGSFQEKDPQYPSPIATQFGSQRSRYDGDTISPMTPSDRRLSQPILVDSRLNPRAVLAFHDNGSRESVGTIDESRDWGRQLNVRNPDLTHRD